MCAEASISILAGWPYQFTGQGDPDQMVLDFLVFGTLLAPPLPLLLLFGATASLVRRRDRLGEMAIAALVPICVVMESAHWARPWPRDPPMFRAPFSKPAVRLTPRCCEPCHPGPRGISERRAMDQTSLTPETTDCQQPRFTHNSSRAGCLATAFSIVQTSAQAIAQGRVDENWRDGPIGFSTTPFRINDGVLRYCRHRPLMPSAPLASASVAIQPDGKIVAAGHGFLGFGGLVRSDGSLDQAFGRAGAVIDRVARAFEAFATSPMTKSSPRCSPGRKGRLRRQSDAVADLRRRIA